MKKIRKFIFQRAYRYRSPWSPSRRSQKKCNGFFSISKFSYQCCGSGIFIPDPNIFHPGSRVKKKSRILIRIKEFKYFNPRNLSILTQNIVSKISEIWYKILSRIRDLDFYPSRIRDPGATRHRIRIRSTDLHFVFDLSLAGFGSGFHPKCVGPDVKHRIIKGHE